MPLENPFPIVEPDVEGIISCEDAIQNIKSMKGLSDCFTELVENGGNYKRISQTWTASANQSRFTLTENGGQFGDTIGEHIVNINGSEVYYNTGDTRFALSGSELIITDDQGVDSPLLVDDVVSILFFKQQNYQDILSCFTQ